VAAIVQPAALLNSAGEMRALMDAAMLARRSAAL
jgi:hypothetical protein